MIDIYKTAFEIQSEFSDYTLQTIVNMVLKFGYSQTIIKLLEG